MKYNTIQDKNMKYKNMKIKSNQNSNLYVL